MAEKSVDFVDTFYMQLDNTSPNKSWLLIAGLSALVLSGVVRKLEMLVLLLLLILISCTWVFNAFCIIITGETIRSLSRLPPGNIF